MDIPPVKSNGILFVELAHQVRLLAIPFPPILISSSTSTLLTQSYISDHPASGIVLVAPPVDNASVASSNPDDRLPEFNYEPHFPILVVSPTELADQLKANNRLVRDYAPKGVGRGGKGVSFEQVQDPTSDRTRMTVERWMDRCGF